MFWEEEEEVKAKEKTTVVFSLPPSPLGFSLIR
jgi:hypothetical protein